MRFDFSGYATRNDLECSDGRIIRQNAFKDDDGKQVPLVWQHDHTTPENVIGHAVLENRSDGVYAYCTLNHTPAGATAKELVHSGDISSLSIYANKLKQKGSEVFHGAIREVSLVLAGANPGATIDFVLEHADDEFPSAIICYDEPIDPNEVIIHAGDDGDDEKAEEADDSEDGKTVQDVFNTLTDIQKKAVYAMMGYAVEHAAEIKKKSGDSSDAPAEGGDVKHSDEGGTTFMKHNVFESSETPNRRNVLSHADQEEILVLAKQNNVGTFQTAFKMWADDHSDHLQHDMFEDMSELFPDWHDLNTGKPKTLKRDLDWVGSVINGVSKSPYSRLRTRFADARAKELRANGYIKGDEKRIAGKIKLLKRTTVPQTIYRKDSLERDDIIDITDFDIVAYQWEIMEENLKEDLALAILVGDDRGDDDRTKISDECIRPIWGDDELFTIYHDVDFDAAALELQGSETANHFSENYIKAETLIREFLYAKEERKATGALAMYCEPHLINVLLLSRDLNGRRIYNTRADVQAALDVSSIHTVEQLKNRTRTTEDGKVKKLLALFVTLDHYTLGSTKGGQITKFDDFDIDFNQYKYLIETRLCGAQTEWFTSIALEEDVTPEP